MRTTPLELFVLSLLLGGCASESNDPDAAVDGSVLHDASLDAGDAGTSADGGTDGGFDASVDDAGGDAGLPGVALLDVDPSLVDDAMEVPIPTEPGSYTDAGYYYGRNSPVMLFLTLLARANPALTNTEGASVAARALAHIRAALTPGLHPLLRGGHHSWQDHHVTLALGVARRTDALWAELNELERSRAMLLMRHALHAANLFCNSNSGTSDERSSLYVDMAVTEAGFLPNQSAAYHSFAIGAYLFFGGFEGTTPLLTRFRDADGNFLESQVSAFRAALAAEGFTDIAEFYDNPDLQTLLRGEALHERANPDPLGVAKPLLTINTRSLENSPTGLEHVGGTTLPVPATPNAIFRRWGHDFAVGAQPKSNVGPAASGLVCDDGRTEFGLADGTMPHEDATEGMPYELNARSAPDGLHTRSSWHYSVWGMQQYMYLLATVASLGYLDLDDPADQEMWERAAVAVEIIRYVGEHKWFSTAGPSDEICTSDHGDAYGFWSGLHWAQGLMDATLFREGWEPPEPLTF